MYFGALEYWIVSWNSYTLNEPTWLNELSYSKSSYNHVGLFWKKLSLSLYIEKSYYDDVYLPKWSVSPRNMIPMITAITILKGLNMAT